MQNVKISTKLIGLILGTIVIISIIQVSFSIYHIYDLSNTNIEKFKKNAYKQKEDELKNYVEVIIPQEKQTTIFKV